MTKSPLGSMKEFDFELFKRLQLARHDDPKIPGFETMTLLVDGKTDKQCYFKKGTIVAQFFGKTIGDAEKNAEQVLCALTTIEKLASAVQVMREALGNLSKPFDVSYETNYYAICEYDKRTAQVALDKVEKILEGKE